VGTSADTIIPSTQGVQAWDRYAYVNNSPIMYTDPTGHCANKPMMKSAGAGCGTQVNTFYAYDVGANGIGRRTSMNDASGSTAWD
jgi:hypothetical protein